MEYRKQVNSCLLQLTRVNRMESVTFLLKRIAIIHRDKRKNRRVRTNVEASK